MNWWLALPAGIRIVLTALDGVLLGALVNWAAAALAYEPRRYSPWLRRSATTVRTGLIDRIPLVGWLMLRRHAVALGRGFWIRPLVVEIVCGAASAWMYDWEAMRGGLLPMILTPQQLALPMIAYPLQFSFAAHVLLGAFMLAASLIDADEMNIPDSITVPGTIIGLVWMTMYPWSLLPAGFGVGGILFLHSIFPEPNPISIQSFPHVTWLFVGLGCYLLWCGGLLTRVWRTGRGYRTAVQLLWTRMIRDSATKWIVLLGSVGSALIFLVWLYEPIRWIGLLTSLMGLAIGGGIVWIVRFIGTQALGREAMGFGDVTLMAMVGTFVGWQAAVLIFFAAPAAAVVLGVVQWLITRNSVLPYGPFLCVSATTIIVAWRPVWTWAQDRFAVPWLVPIVLAIGFTLLGAILGLLRKFRG